MARTLIIKNADFSVNKVATVEIDEDVPCTGIALNKSTSAITRIGGTETLTATATPADTTDSIVWSTSDANVATVAGGIITAVGCGTATITATCGSYSATCTMTVTHVASGYDLTYDINQYLGKSDSTDYLNGGELANRAQGFSDTGTVRLYYNATTKHPYVIPNGANKIEITGAGFESYCFWISSTQNATGGGRCLAYPKDSAGTAASNPRTITIPNRTTGDYAGMDAVGFVFSYKDGTISDSAMEAITVTFTA